MPTIVPEHIIKGVIDGILLTIKEDTLRNVSDEDKILYRLFGDLGYGKFKYYDQAKTLFVGDRSRAREIKTKMAYDGDLTRLPVIYITLGSDDHNFSGIGMNDDDRTHDSNEISSPDYLVRFGGKSNIVLASDSVEEAMLMYHAVRSMLISCIDTFSLAGLENMKFGGADVKTEDDLIPPQVYMKMISLSYEYEVVVPSAIGAMGKKLSEVVARNAGRAAMDQDGISITGTAV